MHGLVPSDGSEIKEPVVLGEADFMIFGGQVRDALVQILTTSHVVFVGLSMTDPNIVGALLDKRVRDCETSFCRFVVASPEAPPEPKSPDEPKRRRTYEQYSRLRSQATGSYLGVTPIFLNSISQNFQLFVELAFARSRPNEYMADNSPIRYGSRLAPFVAKAHQHLGLADRKGKKAWVARRQKEASDALAKKLVEVRLLLDEMARSLDYSESLGHRLQAQLKAGEVFGLFVWVRSLPDELGNPEYALKLAGSSAFVHHLASTGELSIPIAAGTGFPAADAVYYGNVRRATLSAIDGPRPMWKSVFAAPVNVDVSGAEINCGAISLNSSLPCAPEAPVQSVLAYLEPKHQDRLAVFLKQIAVDLFPKP